MSVSRLVLRCRVRELHEESRGASGSRTLSTLLKAEGKSVGRYLARRLMQECGLESCQPSTTVVIVL
ncbi:IS3 family transposase [Xenorhabdus entomophaga]|uniref:IS3 family transposase n=1 Tax=Xenorhabdus entomophaga TaxID=3136257 RepID=UPI0030F3A949